MPELPPVQSVVFLKKEVLEKFADGGAALKVAISTVFQQQYPDGGHLIWKVDSYGAELTTL